MENYTTTNHKVVIVNPTDNGIELHILAVNLPVKEESEETQEQTPPGNVPSPPHALVPVHYQPLTPYHPQAQSIGRGPTQTPQTHQSQHMSPPPGYSPFMYGNQPPPGYTPQDPVKHTPVEVNTTYSHSVLVKDGEVAYIAKSDILDTLKPILIAPIVFDMPTDVLAYVFSYNNFSDHNSDGEEEESEIVHFNPDISSIYLDAISHKYGFYDTLLAMYYVEQGCDLGHVPTVHKKSLHVNQNIGNGFILPFDNTLIAQRLAHSPHMSYMQHSTAKIILSVLEGTKLNDGEMLLINVHVLTDYNNISKYTVSTELATLTKDMSISNLFKEALRIGITNYFSSPRIDTFLMYRLLFGYGQYQYR